jgi:hypothetical protein
MSQQMTMGIILIALGLQTTNSKNSKLGLKIVLISSSSTMMKELHLCLSNRLLHLEISKKTPQHVL